MRAVLLERQRCHFIVMVMVLLGAGSASLRAADAVAPSNEDLRHVRALAEPQVSPDGGRVLVRVTDATADGGRHHLWLVDAGANTVRQLTFSPTADKLGEHDARWLGDGSSIAFLAKRAEHTQLFRLPMSGGEAHAYELKIAAVVDDSEDPDAIPPKKAGDAPAGKDPIPLDVEKYEPAPDGHTIAIIAQDPQTPGEKKQKDEKADALCAPPMSEREIREQLSKARIALDHEVATRLVMEQQAAESLAEIHRMRTDLTFLKRQRDKSN